MAVIMTQEHETTTKPVPNAEDIKCKGKKELSLLSRQEIDIKRYIGPSNPPMLNQEASCVLPLISWPEQQVFKIATQITWYSPLEWESFFPVLGGMHTLMSFV